jgi:tetraacyldisaccharide 4'-kinase
MYDKHLLKSHRCKSTVISIGNITTGGTGKTPLVIWLCSYLNEKEQNVAVLTRGYKTEHGKLTDEPAILAKSCGPASVIVDSDRVRGAEKAMTQSGANILVLDDGFQHRRLKRDLDIIAIDATCPFGFDRMLPAGFLREPLRGLKRAGAVVITHYEQAQPETADGIVARIKKINPNIPIAKAMHEHPFAVMIKGQKLTIEQLREKKIYAFCGIGNPNAFMNNLENLGLNIVARKIYNDHHDYTENDIADIYEEARYTNADLVLSTEKDWVKTALLVKPQSAIIFAYLALKLKFVEGGDELKQLVDETINSDIKGIADA